MKRLRFEIAPTPPYDFALTADCMTYFQSRHAADVFEDGVLRRVLTLSSGRPALASVRSVGGVDAPLLAVDAAGDGLTPQDAAETQRLVRRMLNADIDITPFYAMVLADEHLAPLARNLHGLRLTLTPHAV